MLRGYRTPVGAVPHTRGRSIRTQVDANNFRSVCGHRVWPADGRHAGCGGDGSIGDVIPDGWWRGFVPSWDGTTLEQSSSLQVDLICIYLVTPTGSGS